MNLVREPFIHNYKYFKREYNVFNTKAHYLTLSCNSLKVYIMCVEGFNVGDLVDITYLPCSKVVLKIKKIVL